MQSNNIKFSQRGEALIGQKMFAILDHAKKLESEGCKVIHLELGDPILYPPGRIVNETVMSLLNSDVGYTSSSGLYELRNDLSFYLNNKYANNITINNIIISVANMLIYQTLDIICNEKDIISLFTPAFPTYFASSKYIGLDIKEVPLVIEDGFGLTKQYIDKAFSFKPKVIIVNSGNNPTGVVYSEEILSYLLEQASVNNCWIISDETYSMLSFEKEYFSCLNLKYRKLIVISSFSKVFNLPGYRVGYAVADPDVCDKLSLSSSTLYSCLPIFTQKGIKKGIPILDEFSDDRKKHYDSLSHECVGLINKCKFIRCIQPDSAFYIFIDIGELNIKDEEFCIELLKKYYVAVTPGSSFGYKGFIRISITGEKKDVKVGLSKIIEFSEDIAGRL